MAVIDNRGFAIRAARPDSQNPKKGACLLHLRRICGICSYYEGPLRPAPDAAKRARCGYFDQLRNLNHNAAKCNRWVRKSAPYQGADQ